MNKNPMHRLYFFLIMTFVIFLIPNIYAQSSSEPEYTQGAESVPLPEKPQGAESIPTEKPQGAESIPTEKPQGAESIPTEDPTEDESAQASDSLPEDKSPSSGGGCLIATATFGTELAPEVQQLRELRDNKLLQTEAGTSFMNSFNDFYYSFSPYIADYERENPVFKEIVKITITPMISSLSILNYVDMDSEAEVLGYGISLILLNIGMYFVAPAIVIVGIRKIF